MASGRKGLASGRRGVTECMCGSFAAGRRATIIRTWAPPRPVLKNATLTCLSGLGQPQCLQNERHLLRFKRTKHPATKRVFNCDEQTLKK